jgi:fluoroquinolone transport system permease protein
MTRLLSTMKNDVTIQVRNNLYSIGIGAGLLVAVVLSQLVNPSQAFSIMPIVVLLVAGGSTLLYVAGLIIFEKDEGTLNAKIVSPLRISEYLWSKILTLTTLATLESLIMVVGAMLIMSRSGEVVWPNIALLLIGIVAMAILYTLIGIVMIVRYDKITDFLVPVIVIAGILQIPFVHFWGVVVHPAFLIIPTSAPTLLMQGAFVQLATWEWVYAFGYSAAMILGLSIWAYRAFQTHIVMKVG